MKRVLVIDDAATVRMYYRVTLQGEGLHVEEAVNGIEGLEKVLKAPFDLYIVDVNMPKLDGFGFLRELRSLELPQAPAIMVSTEAELPDLAQAFTAGANVYLFKPVKPHQLLTHVRLLIGDVHP
jgi:two-component system chemotaxis response regulator CheY